MPQAAWGSKAKRATQKSVGVARRHHPGQLSAGVLATADGLPTRLHTHVCKKPSLKLPLCPSHVYCQRVSGDRASYSRHLNLAHDLAPTKWPSVWPHPRPL